MNDLRQRMFDHLQQLSASFYSKMQIGDIMSRFSTDLSAVQSAVITGIPETILGTLGLLTISTLLFIFSWQLALVTVLGLPLALIAPRFLGPRAERDSYLVRHEEAKIASTVQENVSAQPVIRAFSLASLQIGGFRRQLHGFYKISLRFNVLAYLVERTPNLAFLLLQIAVFGSRGTLEFDQERMNELQYSLNRESALETVSQEMGHFRPEITETYLR